MELFDKIYTDTKQGIGQSMVDDGCDPIIANIVAEAVAPGKIAHGIVDAVNLIGWINNNS